jgi:uncharacterized OB-fold protein
MGETRTPVSTPDTARYWQAAREHRLEMQLCLRCDEYFFYPRSHCPTCLTDDVEWRILSGRASLYSYVILHHPAPGFEDEAPYVIAVVTLAEGPRMMTNLVGVRADPAVLELDMPLVVEFTDRGGAVVPNFRPESVMTA